MASTQAGRLLTRQHRQAQSRLNVAVAAQMFALWPLLRKDDPLNGFESWMSAALLLLERQHRVSASLGERYYQQFRTVEVGGPLRQIPRPAFDRDGAAGSLMATGPVYLARQPAERFTRANNIARAATAATAGRVVLNGGRGTITGAVQSDRRALGYARATSGNPCAFCALLAGRGPVYGENADFQAHDHCSCTAEPVYSRTADWPDGSRRYAEIYEEHARGRADPINAFRRAYERPSD